MRVLMEVVGRERMERPVQGRDAPTGSGGGMSLDVEGCVAVSSVGVCEGDDWKDLEPEEGLERKEEE